MRLLIAAGQNDLRLALELLFSEEPGVDIVGTTSECAGLLALIQTTKPELVLAEWELPGGSMAKIIRKVDSMPTAPKMMNLVNDSRSYQKALECGADAVVRLGSSPDVLLAAFAKFRHQSNLNQEINTYEQK